MALTRFGSRLVNLYLLWVATTLIAFSVASFSLDLVNRWPLDLPTGLLVWAVCFGSGVLIMWRVRPRYPRWRVAAQRMFLVLAGLLALLSPAEPGVALGPALMALASAMVLLASGAGAAAPEDASAARSAERGTGRRATRNRGR